MKQLFASLLRLAQVQGQALDRLALQSSLEAAAGAASKPQALVAALLHSLQLPKAHWHAGKAVDPSHAPGLLVNAQGDWGLLRGRNGQDLWVSEWFDAQENKWTEKTTPDLADFEFA